MSRTLSGLTFDGRPFSVELSSDGAVAYGASAGIYKGNCLGPWSQPFVVAVKVYSQMLRPVQQELLIRELRTASQVALRHPLILPFLGTANVGEQRSLVSLYMQNGNLLEYLKSRPGCDKTELVLQVAKAVNYLHSDAGLVHGDLKCENVLISDSGEALLADFGLSTFVEKSTIEVTTMTGIREMHTARFAAPELLLGTDDPTARRRSKTRESDVYAFGMLVLQALTELPPWSNQTTISVIQRVSQGQHPPRPMSGKFVSMSHHWWYVCQRCWSFDPGARPSMHEVPDALSKTGIGPCRQFTGRTGSGPSAAYFPRGDRVVSSNADGEIQIWDALAGSVLVGPWQGGSGPVACVVVSPDGNSICSGHGNGTIRCWDARSSAAVGNPMTGHGSYVNSVRYSPDGTRIVSGSDDRTVRLWDASTGLPVGDPLRGHWDTVSAVAWSPGSGAIIASGSLDRTIQLWDSASGASLRILQVRHPVLSVCFSPNGIHLVSGDSKSTNVQLWNTDTGEIERTMQGHFLFDGESGSAGGGVDSVSVSPSGRHIAWASRDHTMRIWDAETEDKAGEPLAGPTDWVYSVEFCPDGRSALAGSGSARGIICVWDLFD